MATSRSQVEVRPGGWDRGRRAELLMIGIPFGLVMIGVWMPPGRLVLAITLGVMLSMVVLSVRSNCSARQLGLSKPLSGTVEIFAGGAVLAGVIVLAGFFTRAFGPPQPAPWHRVWQYAVWALLQEFMLQSFFFVRLESLMGGRRAVWAAALLFAVPHIPNPLLTLLSFLGALFFCEMFRRYRNLYPLGLVHAALGLAVAASLPNGILHHMRVGLGYLRYHP
ncbi:MAG TPA: CPBP family intramembrane glutamic endopeptidase [Candidatus Sulfotelmatobacter sp.]|nr:CPBP family intramembrane glutamic endopeptidase [Candidatus Sulfotelmatobacter sp.]